jgi:tetratricopeptide (TPR) repeat protein
LAAPYVQRALALFEQRLAQDPGDGKTVDDFGITLLNAAYLENAAGRDDEAKRLFERAIAVVSPLAADGASLSGLVATIADASFGMAEIAAGRHHWGEARAWLGRAREAAQRFAARAPDDPALQAVGSSMPRLEALVAAWSGDHVVAAAQVDAVVAAFGSGAWKGSMAAADILHACWRGSREQPVLARDYASRATARFREAIAIIAAKHAARPDIELQSARALAEVALAELQAGTGELTAAAELLDKALAVLRETRTELQADVFADRRLADGERLAVAIEAQRNPR